MKGIWRGEGSFEGKENQISNSVSSSSESVLSGGVGAVWISGRGDGGHGEEGVLSYSYQIHRVSARANSEVYMEHKQETREPRERRQGHKLQG